MFASQKKITKILLLCALGFGAQLTEGVAVASRRAASGEQKTGRRSRERHLDNTPLTLAEQASIGAAIAQEDAGQVEEAIVVLEGLHEDHRDNYTVLHELAFAYRQAKRPADAATLLSPYAAELPVQTLAMYGSALDEAGQRDEAVAVLTAGLDRYPKSGLLYSELGTTQINAERYNDAIAAYYAGMQAEPAWPSNYLRGTQIMSHTDKAAIALVWGETFCLLEPGPRCGQATAWMAELYERSFTSSTAEDGTVSRVASLTAGDMTLVFSGQGVTTDLGHALAFRYTLAWAQADVEAHSLARVHAIRDGLLEQTADGSGPLVDVNLELLDWLEALRAAGHLEAYDYWLFSGAFSEEARAYAATHQAQLRALADYVGAHPFVPTRAVWSDDQVAFSVPTTTP